MKVDMTSGEMEFLWTVSRRSVVTDTASARFAPGLEALGLIKREQGQSGQLRLTPHAWDVLYAALVNFYAAGPKNDHTWPYLPALPTHLAHGESSPG